MKLIEHMNKWTKKNPDGSFAEYAELFGFTPQLMRHYIYRNVVPQGVKMETIMKVTNGKVTANDFYS